VRHNTTRAVVVSMPTKICILLTKERDHSTHPEIPAQISLVGCSLAIMVMTIVHAVDSSEASHCSLDSLALQPCEHTRKKSLGLRGKYAGVSPVHFIRI
jgi:hypothetical protein